ncbi:prestin-like [Argonauta hians]
MDQSKDVDYYLKKNLSFTQNRFDDFHKKPKCEKPSLSQRINSRCYCSKRKIWKALSTYFPIIKTVRYYKIKSYLPLDALAGLTIGIMHIPQAFGFGKLTSVKTVNGLYTSFWPIVIYMIFGTSPHVSIGTSAIICIMTAGVVDKQAEIYAKSFLNNSLLQSDTNWDLIPEYMDYKEGVAMSTSLLAGSILLFMGIFRLGFITAYLSESFFSAFTSAAAVHIVTSQITPMLGLSSKKHSGIFKIFFIYRDIFLDIAQTNFAEVIISIVAILILSLVKTCINDRFKHKLKIPIPIELFVVIGGTVVTYAAKLSENYNVKIVGFISTEIPTPKVPPVEFLQNILLESFVIAILIFANTIAMAKICAKKHNYEIDDSQELIAYGLCNFVGAFFFCFPSSIAPPRSMIASSMGVRTTLNAVFTSVLMFLVLSVISSLFECLPLSVLAAVIVVALKGLFIQISDLKKFWNINIFDFIIWLITFLSVVCLDIDYGLVIGVFTSLITVVLQSQFAPSHRIARLTKGDLLVEHEFYNSEEFKGVKIFRFESNIYFATAEIFRSSLYRKTINPRKVFKLLQKLEKQQRKQYAKSLSTTDIIGQSENMASESSRQIFPYSVNKEIALNISCILPQSSVSFSTVDVNTNGNPQNESNTSITFSSSPVTSADEETDQEDHDNHTSKENLNIIESIRFIIIDLSSVNYIDASGANVLIHIYKEYEHVHIRVILASCHPNVRRSLEQAGVLDVYPRNNIFVTVSNAITHTRIINRESMSHLDLKNFTDEDAAEYSYITKL